MNSYEKFYREKLYPFQDGVLDIVRKLSTPFYLTGGTALSRHYFNHRFSDDLDLFVNDNDRYADHVTHIYRSFLDAEKHDLFKMDYTRQSKSKDFARFILFKDNPDVRLQVDLVNDVSKHFGDFENDPIMGIIDSWRNILSNKISAIFRYEPKDIADIWIISKNKEFDWQEIISEAKTKELGADPVIIYEILKSLPADAIESIKWSSHIEKNVFMKDIFIIADDILHGKGNSLFFS